MIIIDDIEQGSDVWHLARIGNPGASSFSQIVTTTGAPSKSATKYCYELAAEIIKGEKAESYTNASMGEGLLM